MSRPADVCPPCYDGKHSECMSEDGLICECADRAHDAAKKLEHPAPPEGQSPPPTSTPAIHPVGQPCSFIGCPDYSPPPKAEPSAPRVLPAQEIRWEIDTPPCDDLRASGWVVACHNDYRLNGEAHTFWLFVNGDRAVKGEGRTDAEALARVRLAATASCDELARLRAEAAAQTARVAELAAEKIALKEEIDAGRAVFTNHLLKYDEMVRQRDEAVEAMRWQAKSGGKQ